MVGGGLVERKIEGRRGALQIAEVRLGGLPRGAVVVLWDAGGPGGLGRDVQDDLAGSGYESVAADLTGPEPYGTISDEDLIGEVDALFERHIRQGWSMDQIAVVGFGLGGRTALVLAAARPALGAAVSFAPSGLLRPLSDTLPALEGSVTAVSTPWLGLFGWADVDSPPVEVGRFGRALRAASPVHCEVVGYRGADRSFYRGTGTAIVCDAAFDAWQRAVEWLDRRVVPRPSTFAEAWSRAQSVRDPPKTMSLPAGSSAPGAP
jgi:carboxymethylenebutenolidase